MKNILGLVLIIFPFFYFSQGDYTQVNKYLALIKTENGYIFTDNKGIKSEEFTYVYFRSNGYIETIIVPPIDPNQIIKVRPIPNDTFPYKDCGYPGFDNTIRNQYHVFELMKRLKMIDDYGFKPYLELSWADIRDGKIDELGYASKNGKHAIVSIQGEFISDLKYNHPIYFEDIKPTFNTYTEKGKIVSVVLDKLTGLEFLATKDSIVRYWGPENYLLKNDKGKYFLTYQANKQEVPEIWKYVTNLSFESSLFTYKKLYTENLLTKEEHGFINLKGEKVEPENEIIPYTNFYKGHCIAVEVITEEEKFDSKGNLLPQKKNRILKIINEQFETVKILDEVSYINSRFNKYGQIIVESKSTSENGFIIDYKGNHIIPPSGFPNRITEVHEGVYRITDRAYPASNESQQQENFYNQKGEQLVNAETLRITRNIKFKEGIRKNYLVSYGFKMITLDKENGLIDSYYK